MENGVAIDILKRVPRRTIGLYVTEHGLVEVRAPKRMPMFLIDRFVASQRDWITRTKRKVASRPKAVAPLYREGAVFRLGGTEYVLHVTGGNAIVLAGSRLFFPEKFLRHPTPHMEQFVRTYAKKHLEDRVKQYAQSMGVTYKRVSIRDTKSRWGSSSSTGTVSFAYRLVLADAAVIDYVVVHELAHVTHHHHRASFWDRVGEFCPDYKTHRTWLTRNGHTLRI